MGESNTSTRFVHHSIEQKLQDTDEKKMLIECYKSHKGTFWGWNMEGANFLCCSFFFFLVESVVGLYVDSYYVIYFLIVSYTQTYQF